MDAAALSPERKRELSELRARIYGPGANIPLDETDLARLHELEALLRPEIDEAPESPAAPMPTEREASVPVAPAAAVTGRTPPDPPARRRGWPRLPIWAVIAVAAVVLTVINLVPAFLPIHPDATLRTVADVTAADVDPPQMLSWFDVQIDSLHRHEDFHGLRVWSGTDESGARCLLFSYLDWADGRCTPSGLDPMLDFVVYPGMPRLEGLELPIGSVVRMALRGDVVEVTIAEAAPTSASG